MFEVWAMWTFDMGSLIDLHKSYFGKLPTKNELLEYKSAIIAHRENPEP